MATGKLILLEFNELCPPLLDRWMSEGQLPNFRRFYEQSQVFVARADMPAGEDLQPWIQWYSLHTGIGFRTHGVRNLTDGPLAGHLDIWSILADSGLPVMNWGSMNARSLRIPGSTYLPDPWCQTEEPYPAELAVYQRVVTTLVQENSVGGGRKLAASDLAKFLAFLATRGLSAATVARILGQIIDDVVKRENRWKRAVLLDRLQFDLFNHYWRRQQPAFATFFLNSTAHFQHAYWHHAFPEDFAGTPADSGGQDSTGLRDAILFGYRQMDDLLSGFFELEREGALLVLTTALSQQPSGRTDRIYYRPRNVQGLLGLCGIRCEEVLPVMAEQCSARFVDSRSADEAKAVLERLRVGDQQLLDFGPTKDHCIFFGANVRTRVPQEAVVTGFASGPDMPFHEIFHALSHTKSATHHPDSVLWWKTGTHTIHGERPSILDILPTVIDYFGVARAAYDPQNRLEGRSILHALGPLPGRRLSGPNSLAA
jgi:hypothetical protein